MARGLGGTHARRGVITGPNPVERWPRGVGQTSDRVGGSTKSRATVFALDDATEGLEWRGLHSSLGGMAQLLTSALSTLNGATPTGQVWSACTLGFCFVFWCL
jgi:hypothetical protein